MTPYELGVASLLYLVVAGRYFQHGDPGLALAFAAYALANVGFIWASVKL